MRPRPWSPSAALRCSRQQRIVHIHARVAAAEHGHYRGHSNRAVRNGGVLAARQFVAVRLPSPAPGPGITRLILVCFTWTGCPAGTLFTLRFTSMLPGALVESVKIMQDGDAQTYSYQGNATFTGSVQITAPTVSCLPATAAVGTNTTCSVTLTAPLVKGARVEDAVSQPGGVAITACSTLDPLICTPPPPPPPPISSSQSAPPRDVECIEALCPAGAVFLFTITSTSPGSLAQQLTLSEGGISRSFAYQGQATFVGPSGASAGPRPAAPGP
jgi:hypothetical protein